MSRKIIVVTLFTLVILMTPIIGTVLAVGLDGIDTRPTIAKFEFSLETWPTLSQPNFEIIPPDKKITYGWKNLNTHGGLPPSYDFVENYIPTGPDELSVNPLDYLKGGIKLTLTIGEEEHDLIGTVDRQVLLYIQYNNGRNFGVDEWSITIVDKADAATLGAVGSTIGGSFVNHNGNRILKSTGGTGFFEGVKLTAKATAVTAYPIIGMTAVFVVTTGWGILELTP